MDVLAITPFSASSVEWQNLPAQWMLTVVAKATYTLRPGTSPIAAERDAIAERDNFWDDDPERSLFTASDLAPVKAHPEVTLVGSAFAPHGDPVRTLVVRLRVGSVEKTIEVFVPRTIMADGSIREGSSWKQMPLLYERAAGGPHTWNPRGMGADALDRNGRRSLPNLQRPGLGVHPPDPIEPIGFGPIAATWSGRRERLGIRATSWSDETWFEKPLGVGFDMSFFQTAPNDQLLDELTADQSITLENLHPDHPLLTTRLACIRPRAKLETKEGSWDIELTPDTLAIDTNRSTCTLAWRGRVEVDRPRLEGRVLVGAEEAGGAMRWPAAPRSSSHDGSGPKSQLPPKPAPPRAARTPKPTQQLRSSIDADAINKTVDEEEARIVLPKPALPFRSSGSVPPPFSAGGSGTLTTAPPASVRPLPPPAPPPPRSSMQSWHDDYTEAALSPASTSMPAWLARGAATSAPIAADPPPPPRVAPPSMFGGVAPPPPLAPLGALPREDDPPASRIFSSPAVPPDRVSLGNVNERALGSATYAGVLHASNAAVDQEAQAPRTNGKKESPRRDVSGARALIDLLWFDPDVMPALRADEEWQTFMFEVPPVELPPSDEADGEGSAPKEEDANERDRAKKAADRASIIAVLSRANTVSDVEWALLRAIGDDGSFEPPLSVVAGELETPLDELETLKILMAAAGPLAPTDKKLKDVLDLAQEVMKTPLGASREVAAGFVARVRDAWSKANRLLPADYLDHHSRRLLLDQRLYQKRQLADAEWIRALLTPSGASAPIPVYLPIAVGRRLPLFTRFSARILGELVPQQDETEAANVAVRASAIARAVTPRARR